MSAELERPTLTEAAAVMAAVDVFQRKLRPRRPRPTAELPRMLDELAESIARLRAVIRTTKEE